MKFKFNTKGGAVVSGMTRNDIRDLRVVLDFYVDTHSPRLHVDYVRLLGLFVKADMDCLKKKDDS